MMSDTVAIALIATITPTLAALASFLVSLRNGRKTDVVIEKASEIHAATNGTLHKVTNANDVLIEKVDGLERQLAAALLSGRLAAGVAEQAATDVQAAIAASPSTNSEATDTEPDFFAGKGVNIGVGG